MWCGLILGLLSIVAGIRMIKTGEGLDLRHKHTGNVYGSEAVAQGKGAVVIGIGIIIFTFIITIALKNP